MKLSLIIAFLALSTAVHAAGQLEKQYSSPPPKDGFVPDSQTAIAIAIAVWAPIYGAEKISQEQPFKASLSGDTWTVTGSLPQGKMGGTAIAEISKKDGHIIGITHEK